MRVLIVDDERDICDCLEQFFRMKGYSVASAFSGEEALARLDQEAADVILLDILLPGLSGLEVLKRVHARDPDTRIIVITGLDQTGLRAQAYRYGASAYLTKPLNFSDPTWSAVLTPA